MITDTGKGIIAKYLIGQAPAYASYIAIGCGAKPLASNASLGDYTFQKNLEFEMLRVPIISRGYVNENNIPKIVFTAELPSEERYEITEVGVYSAGSDPSVGFYGSKTLQAFNTESWEYHTGSSSIAIPTIYEPLDGDYKDNAIHDSVSTDPAYQKPVFKTNADNRIFADATRSARYERCRFFNNTIVIAGDDSDISVDGSGYLIPEAGSNHIHLMGTTVDLTKNAPDDELRLAFSVINKTVAGDAPDRVKILLEFSSSDVFNESGSQWARFEINLENGTGNGQHDFDTNRYVVAKKELQQLHKSTGFAWNTVNTVKIYASVEKDSAPSDNYYVCLDALRVENKSSANPLYGLTGYSVISNTDAQTIVKTANTTNFVEFRFAMDVQ